MANPATENASLSASTVKEKPFNANTRHTIPVPTVKQIEYRFNIAVCTAPLPRRYNIQNVPV